MCSRYHFERILEDQVLLSFLWRWFFYIKQYGDHELMKVIAVGKKKIPVEDYLTATIYLTAMKDTMMTMTKEEAEHILHEPATDKRGK